MTQSLLDPGLLGMLEDVLQTKQAFLPATDPSLGGAPQDPSMMGGGMDPSMMGGGMGPGAAAPPMDPMAGGGAPAGGAPTPTMPEIEAMMRRVIAEGGGAGGKGGAGGAKPLKLDPAIEIHRLNRQMAYLLDALGVHIPATEMVGYEDTAQNPTGQGMDPAAAQGGQPGAAPGGGGIAPIQPMPGLQMPQQGGGEKTAAELEAERQHSLINNGASSDLPDLRQTSSRAQATADLIDTIRRKR